LDAWGMVGGRKSKDRNTHNLTQDFALEAGETR
jgi:hypothetical protein